MSKCYKEGVNTRHTYFQGFREGVNLALTLLDEEFDVYFRLASEK